MKTSKAIIIASLIILVGIIFYSVSNRYYIDSTTRLIVDKLTGEVKRAIVETPEPMSNYLWTESDFKTKAPEINKGDFSKVSISGKSVDDSNPYMYSVTCTVKNDDTIPHKLTVKAIFYDKGKNPILTEESFKITVGSNDVEGASIVAFDNVKSISSYELKLIQSEDDGVIIE